MKEIVIWLNHWFSTAYNIVNLIKIDDKLKFRIIGSNEKEMSVLKSICDEWYKEPDECSEQEYIEFCLKICQEHNVDIFMPHRHMNIISKHKDEFELRGVKVLVDNYEIVSILNDKDKAYRFFSQFDDIVIPQYHIATNVKEFENAYLDIEKHFGQVCIKFVHDEGGKSYRLIDNNRKGYSALFKKQNTRMTYENIKIALQERQQFSPLMVMPYLDGKEISVDCLKTAKGNIMIPRVKGTTRFECVEYNNYILDVANRMLEITQLETPCNIQFKYKDGIPYFLEINTRMSGGIHMSCACADVNIPNIAINRLLGIEKEWTINKRECVVSKIEVPVIMEK